MVFKYKKNVSRFIIILTIIGLIYVIVRLLMTKQYKFGDKIGVFDGVAAYSNQKDETKSKTSNFYNGKYTGRKWQCVEFVRRYLISKHGITFSDVTSAFEIPKARFTTLNGSPVQTTNEVKVGSIIIWPKNYQKMSPDGHVAIVSSISSSGINVVEQNYIDNKFNRFIRFRDFKKQNVTILCVK
jgi:glutathionylspermidine amidase/synthetase